MARGRAGDDARRRRRAATAARGDVVRGDGGDGAGSGCRVTGAPGGWPLRRAAGRNSGSSRWGATIPQTTGPVSALLRRHPPGAPALSCVWGRCAASRMRTAQWSPRGCSSLYRAGAGPGRGRADPALVVRRRWGRARTLGGGSSPPAGGLPGDRGCRRRLVGAQSGCRTGGGRSCWTSLRADAWAACLPGAGLPSVDHPGCGQVSGAGFDPRGTRQLFREQSRPARGARRDFRRRFGARRARAWSACPRPRRARAAGGWFFRQRDGRRERGSRRFRSLSGRSGDGRRARSPEG